MDLDQIAAGIGAFLARQLDAAVDVRNVRPLTAGHSNETLALDLRRSVDGAGEWEALVLRTEPEGVGLLEPYDVPRQYHVMTALARSAVPVPRTRWLCEDRTYIGRPFFLMDFVDGEVAEARIPDWLTNGTPAVRRAVSESLIDMVATLHGLDWHALGLDWLHGSGDYLADETERWAAMVRDAGCGPQADLLDVAGWLNAHRPASQREALIHGDCKWGNYALLDGRVVCVNDWEMAAIGDPLADMGYLMSMWHAPDRTARPGGVTALPGMSTREEALARYRRRTGLNLDQIGWYEVLGQFKVAAIILYGFSLWQGGKSTDPRFEAWGATSNALAEALQSRIRSALADAGNRRSIPAAPAQREPPGSSRGRRLSRPNYPVELRNNDG